MARTLAVGPGQAYALPSQAAAAAADGDRIAIAPGSYSDCAVWRASRLTIAATGPGVVIRDRICQGKALFVTVGRDITVQGLTFTHARVPDGNGAGIRAEGANLTVRDSRFLDNEDGILAGAVPGSTIRISGSTFEGNGACIGACAHGVYIGGVALLRIEHSRFFANRVGHHVKSRALRTELIGNTIADGPQGTASYLVDIPNGGDLLMQGNVLEKGPHSDNPAAAIVIGAEGVTHPTRSLAITGNRFTNDQPLLTAFVRNLSTTPARLAGNVLKGPVIPLEGPGSVR
jgi:nitrous oxidase accessory protein NosD